MSAACESITRLSFPWRQAGSAIIAAGAVPAKRGKPSRPGPLGRVGMTHSPFFSNLLDFARHENTFDRAFAPWSDTLRLRRHALRAGDTRRAKPGRCGLRRLRCAAARWNPEKPRPSRRLRAAQGARRLSGERLPQYGSG